MSKSADAFRTISEVADWLGIPAHVLRFWESKFTQVKPVKRAGGRRYYRPADMQLLGGIRKLLHDEGMTIKGVQKIMRDQGVRHVAAMSPPLDAELEADLEAGLEVAGAEIALDVPEEEDTARGQIVSFERRGLPKAEKATREIDAAPPEREQAPPEDTTRQDDASSIPSKAMQAEAADSPSQTDVPSGYDTSPGPAHTEPESPAAPIEPATDAGAPAIHTEADAPLRIDPVETGDDPSDTAPPPPSAAPSVLPALTRVTRPGTSEAAQYRDIAARLADLRQHMQGDSRSS